MRHMFNAGLHAVVNALCISQANPDVLNDSPCYRFDKITSQTRGDVCSSVIVVPFAQFTSRTL